jgi:uncharacterized RDD family membrane protein YckC
MTESPGVSRHTASLRRRVAAHLLDAIVVGLVGFAIAMLVSALLGPALTFDMHADGSALIALDPGRFLVQAAAATLASGLYFTGAWAGPWMATAGQRALGLRVVAATTTDGRLGARQALVRWLLLGAPFGLLAALVIDTAVLWTLVVAIAFAWTVTLLVSARRNAERRGLHDRFAGSIVLRSSPSPGRVESVQ